MSELKITGNPNPVVGKEELYSVNQLLPSPLPFQNLSNAVENPFEQPVDWSMHVLENGRWIKKEENNKRGNKVSYKFIQNSLERKGIRILAKRGEQTARLDIKPQKAESPKIDSIEFLDKNGNKPTKPFAYGQTLKARVHCLHMENRRVYATLWEDDTAGGGHDKANEKNKMKTLPGTVKGGIADIDFVIEPDFAKIADAIKAKGDSDEGKTHEYYVTAEILNKKTASKNTNVANPNYKDTTAKPATPKKQTPAQKKGPSKKQEKEKSVLDDVIDWWEGLIKIEPKIVPNPTPPTGNNPLKIGEVDKTPKEEQVKIEGIITAYFAKEEFTKETTEVDGQHQYTFANNNDDIDRNKIAGIIKKKVDAQVKANKKYAKLDDIKNALTSESYAKGDILTFNLYKLGAEFKKINSAPLEEEVYIVAKTFLLDGKEVSITIKEKEAILDEADADLTFLEAKEGGSDITILKAVVENGIAKVKIKLRPKADEDLKKWKEKLAGNKKDGTHNYIVKNAFTVSGDLDAIASSIEKKSNAALAPNHIVKKEEIKSLLTEGASYTTTNSFEIPKYKKEKITEMLWLKAECQGDTIKHEGEFLKRESEYLVIGDGKCTRCAILTLDELDQIFTDATKEKKEQLITAFNKASNKFGLDTCQQKAHFFAQVREEVGKSIDIKEGEILNYAVEKLTEHYTRFSTTGLLNGPPNDLAFSYGRIDSRNIDFLKNTYNRHNLTEHPANVQMIANIAYAKKEDNDDVASGDGWKYRGRGIIQITYKRKYTKINRRITSDYPEYGKIIDANNINNVDEGTVASMSYWEEYGCQSEAAKGTSRTNLDAIVDIINSRTPSREDRWEHLQKMIGIFKVNECHKDSVAETCTPDCTQCFNYSDVWENPEISSDNGGKNNNRYNHGSGREHKGIDILSGSTYKNVQSLMCGTVEAIVNTFETNEYGSKKLGNVINIKSQDKNGNTVYILYCHLDEVNVSVGQKVSHGQKIALSGSTGNASDGNMPNGSPGHGISKDNWHVHIEACSNGAGLVTFFGKDRLQPEDYMKTKFDNNGNAIK